MDAVLFYTWFNKEINGAIIDAFEYFIKIFESNPNIFLVLINGNKKIRSSLIRTFGNRYNLDDLDFEDKIICCSRPEIIRKEFDKVLVIDYSTIRKTKGILRANEIIVVCDNFTNDSNYMYNKGLYNVTYYGEMPFNYRDKKYRMKILFDRFKRLRKVERGVYVNSPRNRDRTFLDDMDFEGRPMIHKSSNHLKNLFEKFDIYLYYHANTYFDPHPRLFLECRFYGKEIIYINKKNVKDGSYYRYKDLEENGLTDRFLSKDDEIIRKFV